MKRRWVWRVALMVCVFWAGQGLGWAQQSPDTILYNGKIVTVDNHEVNENLGTIAEAIAIRDGKIVAVGDNSQVQQLADGNTKSIDLMGRTVTPGFGATHDHPQDWSPLNPVVVGKVVSDDMHIERFLNVPAAEVVQQFPRVLDEAVQKARAGQWIRISLLFGKEYRWGKEIRELMGRQINKQLLDLAAPNNPLIVRGGFTGLLMNQKAIDAVIKFYGDQWDRFLYSPLGDLGGAPTDFEQTGACGTCYRYVEQDVVYPPDVLAEIYRLGLSWTAALGVTLNGTSLYTGGAIRAYSTLDRQGRLAARFAWGYFWPFRNDFHSDPYLVQANVSREGTGSDYFWFAGMTSMMGGGCSKLPGTSPEVKQREPKCRFAEGSVNRADKALYEYVKAGGRLMGDHQIGDGEIDRVLDIIEKASKDAGMTPEEIRAKRHVTEHMAMYPRPDQIPRYKELGMMTSGWDFFIWEGRGQDVLRDYGERGAMQVVPRKSLYDAGIINSVEIDRPLSEYTDLTYFHVLYSGITRKDWDGKVVAPQQGIGRGAMLKSATLWAGYGVKREDVLGSLEPGKWADLIVLDQDYLTVPVEEIPKLRVLMTMLGGKIVHLVPSLAREWGMSPTGAQVELGGPAAQW